MSGLQPYSDRSPVATWSRTGREVSRIVSSADLDVIRVAARAHVDHARLDAIDTIAARAMQGVALVSQLEQQLAQAVPLATTRLQAVGDMHALASVEVVAAMARGSR